MTIQQKSIKEALNCLRDFITSLTISEELSKDFTPEIFFSSDEDGGLILDREDSRRYVECQKKIVDIATSDEMISAKSVEKLIREAILSSIDLNKRRQEFTFDERIEKSLTKLERDLNEKPVTFEIFYPIEGLIKEGLPLEFGNIKFFIFESERINRIKKYVIQEPFSIDDKENRIRVIDDLKKEVLGKTYCLVEVLANDCNAARSLAYRDIRLAFDIINFYSDLIPYSSGFIFLPGEQNRTRAIIPCLSTESLAFSFMYQVVGPLQPISLRKIFELDEKRNLGFKSAAELLTNQKNKMDERILASIQWAGRATIENRNEEALLLYAIALESLILLENDHAELSYRLRTRVAHLLGTNYQERQEISKQVRDLYSIRSKIVHSGKYQVTDTDLKRMRYLAKSCIIRILTIDTFCSMTSIQDFVNWFEKQVLSAPNPRSPSTSLRMTAG